MKTDSGQAIGSDPLLGYSATVTMTRAQWRVVEDCLRECAYRRPIIGNGPEIFSVLNEVMAQFARTTKPNSDWVETTQTRRQ